MTTKSKSAETSSSKNGLSEREIRNSNISRRRPTTVAPLAVNDSRSRLETKITNVGGEICSENGSSDNIILKSIDHQIPDVYRTQGTMIYSTCTGYSENTCLCSSIDENSRIISSSKHISYLERRSWITTERLGELRRKTQDAMKKHKIFTIRGCFYSIRKSLLQRGWVEKLDIHRKAPITGSCQVILEDIALQHLPQRRPGETRRQHIQKCERNIMSRFLEHMPIDFLWSARKEKSDWIDMARNPNLTINRFHKSPFTTKEGLCNLLENVHWFFEEDKSETYYPRSYSVCSASDLDELIEDFRLTACMSMIRFLIDRSSECVFAVNGQIPLSSIRFALNRCRTFVRIRQHLDIDEEIESVWNHDWEVFLMQFQMLTQDNSKFQKPDDLSQWNILIEECKHCLLRIAEYWPQNNLDGIFNIWIVKPSNRCRGRGIHMMNDLKKIIAHVNPPVVNKGRYVVQKYIERPMIIHKCKFDIRQWFLVTSVQPLVIWMYKESYLRFSSQEYSLENFHESVHLTNHAVQKHYENGKRDERLPRENMWDCHTFQAYLRQIGKSDMWSERIYSGMQKALIGTMLASQESMDRRSNTFELFGADFMLSEDYQPWLIEINASPDLGATTSVTARLCPQCLEDIIKVVIDYRNDPKSSTGNFEMIYRQVIPPAPAYLGLNLFLKGTQILTKNCTKKREKQKAEMKQKSDRRFSQLTVQSIPTVDAPSCMPSPRLLVLNIGDNSISKLGSIQPATYFRKNVRAFTTPRISQIDTKAAKAPQQNTRLKTTRDYEHLKENKSPSKKVMIDPLNYMRNHSSCGIKLPQNNSQTNETRINNSDLSDLAKKVNNIKCIGNKCTGLNEDVSVSNDIHKERKKDLSKTKLKLNPVISSRRAQEEPIERMINDYKNSAQSPLRSGNEMSHFFAVDLS